MGRDISSEQFNRRNAAATEEVYLIRWEHSGSMETISTSGQRVFDGESYSGGVFDKVSTNGLNATLTLPADSNRAAEVNNGTWRGRKICKIYSVAADAGMAETFTVDQAFLVMDGIIETSGIANGRITVKVVHKNLSGKNTPRHNYNRVSSLLTPIGSVVSNDDDRFTASGVR